MINCQGFNKRKVLFILEDQVDENIQCLYSMQIH